jgi:hypothetical protein
MDKIKAEIALLQAEAEDGIITLEEFHDRVVPLIRELRAV